MSDDIVTRLLNAGEGESSMMTGVTLRLRFPLMIEAAHHIELLQRKVFEAQAESEFWEQQYDDAMKLLGEAKNKTTRKWWLR